MIESKTVFDITMMGISDNWTAPDPVNTVDTRKYRNENSHEKNYAVRQ